MAKLTMRQVEALVNTLRSEIQVDIRTYNSAIDVRLDEIYSEYMENHPDIQVLRRWLVLNTGANSSTYIDNINKFIKSAIPTRFEGIPEKMSLYGTLSDTIRDAVLIETVQTNEVSLITYNVKRKVKQLLGLE